MITFSFHGDNWAGYGKMDQGYVTPVGGDGTRKVCWGDSGQNCSGLEL